MGCQLCGIDRDMADKRFKEAKRLKRQAKRNAEKIANQAVELDARGEQIAFEQQKRNVLQECNDRQAATIDKVIQEAAELRGQMAVQRAAFRCDENDRLEAQLKDMTSLRNFLAGWRGPALPQL